MIKWFIIFSIVTFQWPNLAWAQLDVKDPLVQKRIEKVSSSQRWLRLMHYRPNWLGTQISEVDGAHYFFSSKGKTDPRAELEATVAGFVIGRDNIGSLKQKAQCAFPLRYRFIKEHFDLGIKDIHCEQQTKWKRGVNAESISLIFASNFITNPASYFGHTFLRFNQPRDIKTGKKVDFLDYTLGFAAASGKNPNPLEFAWRGLFGGYQGAFEMVPYYIKVNEYNNIESRDVWEYTLNFNKQEVNDVVDHVWELGTTTYFDYYFLDENCSYQLLTILEVARENLDISKKFLLYAIPGETVKAAQDAGIVIKHKLRPGARKKYLRRKKALDSEQLAEVSQIVSSKMSATQTNDPMVVETVLAYLSYKKFKNLMKLDKDDKKIYDTSLMARSKMGELSDKVYPSIEIKSRPDRSHDTINWGISTGLTDGQFFSELQFKPAVHDFLNEDTGFNPNSQLDMLKVRIRHLAKENRFDLEEFVPIQIATIIPISEIEKPLSWSIKVNYGRSPDLKCKKCKLLKWDLGAGYALGFAEEKVVPYVLGHWNSELGSGLEDRKWRTGPSLSFGVLSSLIERYKMQFLFQTRTDLFQNKRQNFWHVVEFNQGYQIDRHFDFRLYTSLIIRGSAQGRTSHEQRFNFNYYF